MTRPEIVQVPAMRVVGTSIRTTNAAEADAAPGEGPILQAWKVFRDLNLASRLPNPHVSGEVVAAYHDYASDHTGEYTLTIGLRVTSLHQVPDGMVGFEVPFQTYARFPFDGPPERVVAETWSSVLTSDLSRAYTCDLEVYTSGDDTEAATGEILVAVSED